MHSSLFPAALVVLCSVACGQQAVPSAGKDVPASQDRQAGRSGQTAPSPYVPVTKYDAVRDPAVDLQNAVAEATRTGKRILLEVGGEWCVWCHTMDAYFDEHPTLLERREQKFVTVKINFSEENENKTFLSQYPKIPGFPHIFVLESSGAFLHSQGTGELESGKSYDLDRFSGFLKRWEPTS